MTDDTPQPADAQADVAGIQPLTEEYIAGIRWRQAGNGYGRYKNWEQAKDEVNALLRERDARERRLRELESVYDQHYPTPVCTAVPHEEQRSYGLGYSHGVAEVLKALYPILHPEAKETRP